jgi:hypothetical protein
MSETRQDAIVRIGKLLDESITLTGKDAGENGRNKNRQTLKGANQMAARFTTNATTDELRAALIDDDIDGLMTPELIDEIIAACWSDFYTIARRYQAARYANDGDVWEEATDRGYFISDHDD